MKQLCLTILIIAGALASHAQTNAPARTNAATLLPVNPGVVILDRIEKERASIKAKEVAAIKKRDEALKLVSLQRGANKISDRQSSDQSHRAHIQYGKEVAPGQKRLGELDLQEYQTRKAYNLPESKPAKQRGYGNR